jgi:hypothetical protein
MVVTKIFEVMSKTFMRSTGNLEYCGQNETINLHNYFYLGLISIYFILDTNGRICVKGVITCFLNGLLQKKNDYCINHDLIYFIIFPFASRFTNT